MTQDVSAAFVTSSGKPGPANPEEIILPLLNLSPSSSSEKSISPPSLLKNGDGPIYPDGSGPFQHVDGTDYLPLDPWLDNFPEEPIREEHDPILDIPIVFNDSVDFYMAYFKGNVRNRFNIWLERSGKYLPLMKKIFRSYGLPEDLVYLSMIESGFNPFAHSRAHAVGAWQFMRGTARLYQLRIDRWVDERRDPIKSTDAAARHLKDLYERFKSWPLAMASYNAGAGKISRAIVKTKSNDYWDIRNTRYIRRETKGYVPKYMAALLIAKHPDQHGFNPQYHEPFAYGEVSVPGLASLTVIAKAAGISYKELKGFNPELRTEITPPSKSLYTLRLPPGKKKAFKTSYARIPDSRKLFRARYVVKRYDTLSKIAKRYGTSVTTLARMNHRSTRKLLRIGEVLYIPKVTPRSSSPKARKSEQMTIADASARAIGKPGSQPIVYHVQNGDTLWDIAMSFKVSLSSLKRNNQLGRKSVIHPGDLIILGYK